MSWRVMLVLVVGGAAGMFLGVMMLLSFMRVPVLPDWGLIKIAALIALGGVGLLCAQFLITYALSREGRGTDETDLEQ